MIKDNIDWKTIDEKLKNLKFPLTFIYSIIKNQKKINDYDLSLILRFFFKNQTDLTLEFPLYAMTNLLTDNFKMSKRVVYDYYSSIIKKFLFCQIIQKFKKGYSKEEFLKLDLHSQKIYIQNLLNIFKAHFDSSYTGFPGATKFISQIKFKNEIISEEIRKRFNMSIELFGLDFFKNSSIKLIRLEDFNNLKDELKVKYLLLYYMKVEKYLNQMINAYDLFVIFDIKIKQIISPKPINICFDIIYSDNDSEDMNMLIDS